MQSPFRAARDLQPEFDAFLCVEILYLPWIADVFALPDLFIVVLNTLAQKLILIDKNSFKLNLKSTQQTKIQKLD